MKSGWVTKRLGEVCEIKRGGSPRPIKDYITTSPDGLNWIKIGDVDPSGKYIVATAEKIKPSGLKKTRQVFAGDFLLSNSMSYGRPYILRIDGCIHDGWLVLRGFKNVFDENFFYYLLRSGFVQEQFDRLAYGAIVSNLNSESVAKVEVPVISLPEQRRIVSKIDAAFEKIDRLKANAEKNLANAKELFQSSLNEALRPKKGWVEKRLGEVAEIRVGPFGSSLHKTDYVANGVPLVNPCHMRNSCIQESIETQVSTEKANELSAYKLREGDIVFARRGEIGRLAFVSRREDGYLCGTGSLFARFKEKLDPEYLYYVFSGKSFVERLEKLSTGATMKSINSSALESMTFFAPPDAAEMKRSVAMLNSLRAQGNQLQSNYTRLIADCAEMKQAVLKDAFEGKL